MNTSSADTTQHLRGRVREDPGLEGPQHQGRTGRRAGPPRHLRRSAWSGRDPGIGVDPRRRGHHRHAGDRHAPGQGWFDHPVHGDPAGATPTARATPPRKGYLVYSYLVQEGTSPTSVIVPGRVPVDVATGCVTPPHTYYGPANTAPTTGEIIGIPNNLECAPLVTNFGVPSRPCSTPAATRAGSGRRASPVPRAAWSPTTGTPRSPSRPAPPIPTSSSGPIRRVHARPHDRRVLSAGTATFTKARPTRFMRLSGCPAPTITETGPLTHRRDPQDRRRDLGKLDGQRDLQGHACRPKSAPERRPLRPSHRSMKSWHQSDRWTSR